MILPAEDTLAAGAKISAAWANSDIRDAVNAVLAGWACSVNNSGNISCPTSGTAQLLTWDSEDYDTDGIHSTVTNTSAFTCQTPGSYLFMYSIAWSGSSTGTRRIDARLNAGGSFTGGTALPRLGIQQGVGGNAGAQGLVGFGEVRLSVGQTVEFWGTQASGGALNVLAGSWVTCRLVTS